MNYCAQGSALTRYSINELAHNNFDPILQIETTSNCGLSSGADAIHKKLILKTSAKINILLTNVVQSRTF